MYEKAGSVAAAGMTSGGLAFTGLGSLWLILAAFALLAAGAAMLRIAPRLGTRKPRP